MDSPNDIEKTLEPDEADILSLKKDGVQATGGDTRMKSPVPETPAGLNQELVNMLTLGKKSYQFQGIDRCIRILDKGTPNQRHCMAMMINNLSTKTRGCSSCDRIRDPNARPTVINSASIRLSQKELEQCGLDHDPLLNAKSEPIKQPKRLKVKEVQPVQRRPKVAVPNTVKIEITMKELEQNPDIVDVLLQKALEAIYELPITKFSEAEAIRGTSEKIKNLLRHGDNQGD
jgi:hypothetical protein